MKHLLYLFEVGECNSCRGLPPMLRGHYALMFYRFLLSALLEGDRTLRIKGAMIGRTADVAVDPEKTASLLGDVAAAYVGQVREFDPRIGELLVPSDPLDGDDATYTIARPEDISPEDMAVLNARIDAASQSCAPMFLPSDVEEAWRVVLSEEAARRGIDFPAVRPRSTS